MSDLPAPAPSSSIQRFGTSVVGKQFEFEGPNETGDGLVVVTARATAAMTYPEVLRYTTGLQSQIVQAARSSQTMREELEQLPSPSDPTFMDRFNAVCEARLIHEGAAWEAIIDTLLILVNPADRPALRPFLVRCDPKVVAGLRAWLEQEVLGAAQLDARNVTGVDPTLRPQPDSSSSDPDSGDGSGSEEPTSSP